MAYTIEKALDDDLIELVNRNDDLGIYEFRVGVLDTIVTVEIGCLPTSERARYHRSHDIKTPSQAGPYHQSRYVWDDVPYALFQAIDSITSYYRMGVKDGYAPQESWLVET
jgi:hypothetical protein